MPRYLTLAEVMAFHQLVMVRTGANPASLRDVGLLESAIARPQSVAHYEDADLVRQAVQLAVGISQAQAFLDGNKRTAYAACDGFLRLNGVEFSGDPLELAQYLERIAAAIEAREDLIKQFERWLGEETAPAGDASDSSTDETS